MQKAKRGFGAGRFVWVAMVGSLAFALAGCGGNDSGSSGIGAASGTSTTGSSTPPTVADGAPSTTTSGSSSTTTAPPSSTAASSSSVTLGWVAPTQNNNGTPITNLAGYKIHYGAASQDYTQVVALNNPSLSRYVVDSLPSGTYFFAITAYNSQGVESALSGEVSATLN